MIPASYPLVGPSLRLRDAGGYEPTLSPSIEFAGALISQLLRHLASCDDGGGSIDGHSDVLGISTANEWTFYQQRKTRSSSLAAESNRIGFWGDKGRAGEYMLYILLYDYPLTIPCVIQAARASGGAGGVGNYKPMVSTIRQFRQ